MAVMVAERLSSDRLEDAALDRLFERGFQLRVYLAPPLLLTTIIFLSWDTSSWRRWVLATLASVVSVVLTLEAVRARRYGISRSRLPRLFPVPLTVMTVVIAASGGVDSPLVVIMPLVSVFLSLFFAPRYGFFFAGFTSLLVTAAAMVEGRSGVADFIPDAFGGGPRLSNDALLATRAAALVGAVWWGALMGWLMRRAFRSALEEAVAARDEVLRNQHDSTRTLTTLSAEIAHELKNPLSSVKGLAALLTRAAEGKDAERLGVLRREVDRMQEILESFLTFSRPLVPLDVAEVSLKVLAQHVIDLHEGVALERGVSLRLDARDVSVRGDNRKLKQVLINLVQNALDAAPRGSAIDLLVHPTREGGGAVLVLDRGAGVTEPLRVFEPGVTTKPHGSGLGLTISRLVARQHGGEVVLRPRDAGGTIAELTVPGAPP